MTRETRPSQSMPSARTAGGAAARRGTVLLFVLGVLTVIAAAGLSYVSFVRVERRAAEAESAASDGDSRAIIVRDHIAAILAADLFGNKIVTDQVPESFESGVRIWPSMFEDGEARDYPDTNMFTFDVDDNPEPQDTLQFDDNQGVPARFRRFRVAPQDDAWLAPVEPVWNAFGDQHHWRQITNLRSAYTYDFGLDGQPGTRDDFWRRGDGLYVDLGQFFFDYVGPTMGERGNPSTDLLDPTLALGGDSTGYQPGPVLPWEAAGNYDNAPFVQLSYMDSANPISANRLEKGGAPDTRFWADTDGDLRPDARWQALEALGSHNGLLWVTAARIVDASAFVNYNAALESAYESFEIADFATGHTPADVDLYRLLKEAAGGSQEVFNARTAQFNTELRDISVANVVGEAQVFENHVNQGLDVISTLRDLSCAATSDADATLYARSLGGVFGAGNLNFHEDGVTGERLSPTARSLLWRWVGSDPLDPLLGNLSYDADTQIDCIALDDGERPRLGYPIADILDLHAFRGVNHRSLLSAVEKTFDGPETIQGFLPRRGEPGVANELIGPLQARQESSGRVFGDGLSGPDEGTPTANWLRYNTRGLLTPISGASDVSPIPVLNLDATRFQASGNGVSFVYRGVPSVPKVRLATFDRNRIPDAFGAFVWSLAPLATDRTLAPGLQQDLLDPVGKPEVNARTLANLSFAADGLGKSYHYGGKRPNQLVRGPADIPELGGGDQAGPAFALKTAAALAINLADASDSDSDPTVARLLTTTTLSSSTLNDAPIRSRNVGDITVLGDRFPHGDIPAEMLLQSTDVLGQKIDEQNARNFNLRADQNDDPEGWLTSAGEGKGLTLVGLEPHPYILEAFSAAVYETGTDASPNSRIMVNPDMTQSAEVAEAQADQEGALLAFQIANPWSVEIDLSEYEIWIQKPGVDDLGSDEHIRLRVATDQDFGDFNTNGNTEDEKWRWTIPPALEGGSGNTDRVSVYTFTFWYTGDTTSNAGKRYLGDLADPAEVNVDALALDDETLAKRLAKLDEKAPDPDSLGDFLPRDPMKAADPGEARFIRHRLVPVTTTPSHNLIDDQDGEFLPVFFTGHVGGDILLVKRTVPGLQRSGVDVPLIVDRIETPPTFPAIPREGTETFITTDAGGDMNFDAGYLVSRWGYNATLPLVKARLDGVVDSWIGARLIHTGSVTRPSIPSGPDIDGLPAFVVDYGEAFNAVRLSADGALDARGSTIAHAWLEPVFPNLDPADIDPATGADIADLFEGDSFNGPFEIEGDPMDFGGGFQLCDLSWQRDRLTLKLANEDFTSNDRSPAAFQFFVPNRPLRYLSELHMLSTYAHLCLDNNLTSIDAWTTVGEQLGLSTSYAHGVAPSAAAEKNPYIGVLDPSRFIASGQAFVDVVSANQEGTIRDQSMAVPLATRVFDCFEALEYEGSNGNPPLANGRVNINTAPERVLQSLPLVAPTPDQISVAPLANPTGNGIPGRHNDRVRLITQYRDAWDPQDGELLNHTLNAPQGYSPGAITAHGIDSDLADPSPRGVNLRRSASLSIDFSAGWSPSNLQQYPFRRGFATPGELTILNAWEQGAFPTATLSASYPSFGGGQADGFAALAQDGGQSAEKWLDAYPRDAAYDAYTDDAGLDPADIDELNVATGFEPSNDVEERLALYKAVSNIVTARSDVFIAWFVVRGYDPARIEAITVDRADPARSLESTDPDFSPAYESRWLAVFDRSNVRRPTDRPNLLLFSRLPSSSP